MEDLMQQIDGYCERTDFTYWSEPVNAVTNLSFILAAIFMYYRVRDRDMPLAVVLCAITFAIGVGSYLFHTHATVWAVILDVLPIGLYILVYLYGVNTAFCGVPKWRAAGFTALYIPYALVLTPLLEGLPFFGISNFYWTVPILIFAYAAFLRKSYPDTSFNMSAGAALLCLSISLRSIDETFCAGFPLGTHFLWHILNGIMLGWMIETYRRHLLHYGAGAPV